MKVPFSWLKQYVDREITPEQVAQTLTLAGIEVDKIERTPLEFEGVVVAKVLSAVQHPNADKLRLATVFDGKEELQIVCGAPNCRAGMVTALARIGASLPEEEGKKWKIKKSKIRDVESCGMLCTEKELGISENHAGLIEYGEEVTIGQDVKDLYSDAVFEISLTPNLGHCMSVIGIARELCALLNARLQKTPPHLTEDRQTKTAEAISVRIEDQTQCRRYACRLVKNVVIGPSPHWLKKYLEQAGLRSINNAVDVGNFVLLEYGQPLHMFDYDKLRGKKIIVTSNPKEKKFLGLDDVEYDIPEGTLTISDEQGVVAIAGLLGGKESSVTESTKNILIESCYFTPESVRRTCKRMGRRTDGSQRFERGVDPNGTVEALNRAALLLQQTAGGSIAEGVVDSIVGQFEHAKVTCRVSRVNALLGTALSRNEIANFFERLEMHVGGDHEALIVKAPTYRHDIKTEIDLVEEVARVYGYNNIPKTIPHYASAQIPHSSLFLFENEMRRDLIGEGLQEWMTCDLISPTLAELCIESTLGKEALISVLHPSSSDQSVLRTTFLPGHLQIIKYNQDHQNEELCGFEVGKIHFKADGEYREQSMAAITLCGKSAPYHSDPKPKEVDYYDLKGIVENILQSLGIKNVEFEPSHLHNFHPFRQARVKLGNIFLGALGEVHPGHLQTLGIKGRVYFAELNLHDLMRVKRREKKAKELSPFPGSERDWTITLSEEIAIGPLLKMIAGLKSPVLEKVFLLDLYRSDQLGKDKKNATFRFIYREKDKTIAQETVDREHAKILEEISTNLSK